MARTTLVMTHLSTTGEWFTHSSLLSHSNSLRETWEGARYISLLKMATMFIPCPTDCIAVKDEALFWYNLHGLLVIGQIRHARFVFWYVPNAWWGPSKSKVPTRWEWVKSPAEENDNWFILWCDKQSTIIFGNLQLLTFCALSRFKAEI